MKSKTNFTYKEFIQKISNVPTPKQSYREKSPKTLIQLNNNNFLMNDNIIDESKTFFKKIISKSPTNISKFNLSQKQSKIKDTQNHVPVFKSKDQYKNLKVNDKNLVNSKLKVNNNNKNISSSSTSNQRHNKSLRDNNSNNLKKSHQQQRHLQSCSTFFRQQNNNFDENIFMMDDKRVPVNHVNLKLKNKKCINNNSNNNILPNRKSKQGNLTERNYERVNTQYENRNNNKDYCNNNYERINTQYDNRQRVSTLFDRQFPSFYQKSIDQPNNFIDFQDNDDTVVNLFDNSHRPKSMSYQNQLKSSSTNKPKINQKSNQYVYNKFITQINDVLTSITKITQQSLLLQHKIKYIEYLQCLKELKMIKNDYEPYSQSDGIDLVRQFWEQLIVGHNINHFIVVLSIVLKISPLSYLKQEKSKDFHNYVYLQKKYQYFRFTKLELTKPKLNFDNQSNITKYTAMKKQVSQRQLTPKSKSKKKYKINGLSNINQNNNGITQTKPLIQKNFINNHNNLSLNTDFHENSLLYPYPIQASPSLSKPLTSRSPLGIKRSQILYQHGRKKSLQKRCDKSSIDYQYQKSMKQLTFRPKLIVKKKNQQKNISNNQNNLIQSTISPRILKDQEKMINRMIRGRIQKQIKKITIGKGCPYNQKVIEKIKKEKYQEVIKQMQQNKIKHSINKNIQKSRRIQNSIEKQIKNNININNNIHDKVSNSQQVLAKMLDLSFNNDTNQTNSSQFNYQHFNFQHNNNINNSFMQKDIINDLFPNQPHRKYQQNLSPVVDEQEIQFHHNKNEIQQHQSQLNGDNLFILDIYIGEDQCEKLEIRRDASLQEVNAQAEKFVKKYNLSSEMLQKLKNQLTIAMKFHNLQKIDQNAEEQEYSLIM